MVYVPQQALSHFACAVPPGVAVPSWAYVSCRLRCPQLISYVLLNVADQSSFSDAYHKYFLCMLVLLCSLPSYVLLSLSGDIFCPIVSCVTARDNRRHHMERLRSLRSLAFCRSVCNLLSSSYGEAEDV
jgi:hypothetical protein